AIAPAIGAIVILAAAAGPEVGRMTRFAGFSTFNPAGPGLGNLFNRISPLEALGIWPSGDFRVEPGGGFAPAPLFWLGSALALAVLAVGVAWKSGAGAKDRKSTRLNSSHVSISYAVFCLKKKKKKKTRYHKSN